MVLFTGANSASYSLCAISGLNGSPGRAFRSASRPRHCSRSACHRPSISTAIPHCRARNGGRRRDLQQTFCRLPVERMLPCRVSAPRRIPLHRRDRTTTSPGASTACTSANLTGPAHRPGSSIWGSDRPIWLGYRGHAPCSQGSRIVHRLLWADPAPPTRPADGIAAAAVQRVGRRSHAPASKARDHVPRDAPSYATRLLRRLSARPTAPPRMIGLSDRAGSSV